MQQRNGDTDLFESQTDICGGLDGSTWVAEDKAFNSERLATLRQPQQVKPRNMRQGVKRILDWGVYVEQKPFSSRYWNDPVW